MHVTQRYSGCSKRFITMERRGGNRANRARLGSQLRWCPEHSDPSHHYSRGQFLRVCVREQSRPSRAHIRTHHRTKSLDCAEHLACKMRQAHQWATHPLHALRCSAAAATCCCRTVVVLSLLHTHRRGCQCPDTAASPYCQCTSFIQHRPQNPERGCVCPIEHPQ